MFGTRKGTNQLGGGCHFLGIFTTMQLPEWILEISFNIISSYLLVLFVVCTLWSAIYVASLPISLPLPFAGYLLPFFVCLGAIGKLDSCFFTHHALILSHTAWLTGSWSACSELLITSTPPPFASPSYTHIHTKHHFCVVGASAKLFPPDSCDFLSKGDYTRRHHTLWQLFHSALP